MEKLCEDEGCPHHGTEHVCVTYVTNPVTGGKVTCHKCGGFIPAVGHTERYGVYFHRLCFNRYEHYYGLDKPID